MKSVGDLFEGFPIKGKVPPLVKGTPEYQERTEAIACWRQAGKSGTLQAQTTCRNAARELEIERDRGYVVHINTRTKPKYGE